MFKHPQKQLVLGKYLQVFLIDPSLGIIYNHLLSALHLPIGTFSFERRNTVENPASTTQTSEPHILPLHLRFSVLIVVCCCLLYQAPKRTISCFSHYLCAPSIYLLDLVCGWLADWLPSMPMTLGFRGNNTKLHRGIQNKYIQHGQVAKDGFACRFQLEGAKTPGCTCFYLSNPQPIFCHNKCVRMIMLVKYVPGSLSPCDERLCTDELSLLALLWPRTLCQVHDSPALQLRLWHHHVFTAFLQWLRILQGSGINCENLETFWRISLTLTWRQKVQLLGWEYFNVFTQCLFTFRWSPMWHDSWAWEPSSL